MPAFTNLPTDLLRTFIAVVELGGHSKAGQLLGRSQPAISLQVQRLEDLVRAPLLTQEGRTIQPTPAGEALLSYAREREDVFWSVIGASWFWFLGAANGNYLAGRAAASLMTSVTHTARSGGLGAGAGSAGRQWDAEYKAVQGSDSDGRAAGIRGRAGSRKRM
mgnify:CR=1 FL=1